MRNAALPRQSEGRESGMDGGRSEGMQTMTSPFDKLRVTGRAWRGFFRIGADNRRPFKPAMSVGKEAQGVANNGKQAKPDCCYWPLWEGIRKAHCEKESGKAANKKNG